MIIAMPSDLRLATSAARSALLFTRVPFAGRDMGACAILPRILSQGRAAELLYAGRTMSAEGGQRWGFYNRPVDPEAFETEAVALATRLSEGPTFAHAMTRGQLMHDWSMGIDQAIEAEAQAPAICTRTRNFVRAKRGIVAKQAPAIEGD